MASGFFYASVAALFAAVCITAPMTLARSSGWLCVGLFSLLLFPVARKTVVLSTLMASCIYLCAQRHFFLIQCDVKTSVCVVVVGSMHGGPTTGLFYGLPFEAAIGHHRILGRAFVLIQLIHILFV